MICILTQLIMFTYIGALIQYICGVRSGALSIALLQKQGVLRCFLGFEEFGFSAVSIVQK